MSTTMDLNDGDIFTPSLPLIPTDGIVISEDDKLIRTGWAFVCTLAGWGVR